MQLEEPTTNEHALEWIDSGASHQMLVVFVHGFGGDARTTWRYSRLWNIGARPSFPELLRKSGLPCDVVSFRHSCRVASKTDIHAAANSLRTYLQTKSRYAKSILVAHSLGGVVCRQLVLTSIEQGERRAFPEPCGLLMYGTPNTGTEVARLGSFFSMGAEDIEPFSDYLYELNRHWVTRVVNGGDPAEVPQSRSFLRVEAVIGNQDRVVPRSSAGAHALLGELHYVDKDHDGLPKPTSEGDLVFQIGLGFMSRVLNDERTRLRARRLAAEKIRFLALQEFAAVNDSSVRYEEEDIRILSSTATDAVYDVETSTARYGWSRPQTFRIALRLDGTQVPHDVDVHYDAVIGRGVLSDVEFDALASDFSKGLAASVVSDARVQVEERNIASTFRAGRGCAFLEFDLGEASDTLGDLQFSFRRLRCLKHAHRWHSYVTRRPYLDGLLVRLTAPWRLGRPKVMGTWVHSQLDEGRAAGNGEYTATARLTGPIPRGVEIQFNFSGAPHASL